jgi:cytochrome c-type biogenesis protein CcmH/NrfG
MQHYRKMITIAVAAALVSLGALGAYAACQAAQSTEQASYVRVCRDSRGLLDRRACHANDPKRTQLALNLGE